MAEERGGASDKSELKKALAKKVDYLTRKPKLSPIEAYNLVKKFFQSLTGNHYEFTREELVYELDKVYLEEDKKLRLQEIVERLGEVEFSQPQYSQDELKSLLREFGEIAEGMIHEEHVDLGFWDKVAKKFKKKAKKEEPQEESKSPIESFMDEISESSEDFQEDVSEESSEELLEKPPETDAYEKPGDYFEEAPSPTSAMEEEPPSPRVSQEEPPAPEPEPSRRQEDDQEPAPWSVPTHKQPRVTEEDLIENEFDKVLEEFHENLDKGNVIMAKLDYEEMKHAYDKMETNEQHDHYKNLNEAYERLQDAMKNPN